MSSDTLQALVALVALVALFVPAPHVAVVVALVHALRRAR